MLSMLLMGCCLIVAVVLLEHPPAPWKQSELPGRICGQDLPPSRGSPLRLGPDHDAPAMTTPVVRHTNRPRMPHTRVEHGNVGFISAASTKVSPDAIVTPWGLEKYDLACPPVLRHRLLTPGFFAANQR
ncbi:hypothetical protein LY76DRAFT_335103 [Colletotrichum caudatum]|nr:hypothetical protein LY76DRAFT_335103 [Colletotrichum caudatum]